MFKKITFLAKIIILILIGFNFTYAADLEIVPLKKPILKKEIKEEKISKTTNINKQFHVSCMYNILSIYTCRS